LGFAVRLLFETSENRQRDRQTDTLIAVPRGKKKKVKFSHTRYRALGPELIPVYRQSARR